MMTMSGVKMIVMVTTTGLVWQELKCPQLERAGKIEKHVSASSWSWNDGQDNDYDESDGYIENNDYDESDGHYVDDDAKADISLKI